MSDWLGYALSGQRQWKYRDRARIWPATRDQSQQPMDPKIADVVNGLKRTTVLPSWMHSAEVDWNASNQLQPSICLNWHSPLAVLFVKNIGRTKSCSCSLPTDTENFSKNTNRHLQISNRADYWLLEISIFPWISFSTFNVYKIF